MKFRSYLLRRKAFVVCYLMEMSGRVFGRNGIVLCCDCISLGLLVNCFETCFSEAKVRLRRPVPAKAGRTV